MIAEIGNFTLSLALIVAFVQLFVPFLAYKKEDVRFYKITSTASYMQLILIAISFACLTYSFLVSDFSVHYVASHSNTKLPTIYKISAVWGAHEGSLLLWVLILSTWTASIAAFSSNINKRTVSILLGVLGFISFGFLLFILFTSNPFNRLFPVPLQGKELNPLLQDFGLAIHPPMLYLGYVGFSVAFAFAIAALIEGKVDATWAKWARPWTNLAWMFLTIGIVLGSWWAYYELGWGGWWFWDPVENASFMPWLVGTALIHSLSVTEKRGAFASWTILLAISAFSLSLLGTFLVRSGVLTSVHAFATDPTRGLFILIYLLFVVGGSLLLYTFRAHKIQSEAGKYNLISRESGILINNIVLYIAMLSILLGTLYPLIIDGLGLGKISVGPPYFNTIFSPLILILLLVCGVGMFLKWKEDSLQTFSKRLLIMLVASVIVALFIVNYYEFKILSFVGIAFALWVMFSAVIEYYKRINAKQSSMFKQLLKTPASFNGMIIAHIGFGICVLGVTLTSFYSIEKDIRLSENESYKINNYEFTFKGVKETLGPNYSSTMGDVIANKDGYQVTLNPEKRTYESTTMPMTEAAIDDRIHRDLYVALGTEYADDSWSLRLYYKPFIRFIWLGGLLMALGALIAIMDKRYRMKKQDTIANVTA